MSKMKNLPDYLREGMMGPAPCDGCFWRRRCASGPEACSVFACWVENGGTQKARRGPGRWTDDDAHDTISRAPALDTYREVMR